MKWNASFFIFSTLLAPILVLPLENINKESNQHDNFSGPPHNIRISTDCGEVTGRVSISNTKTKIYEFHNIPYATPPVGSLRFEAPQVYNNNNTWTNHVDATHDKTIRCVQTTWSPGTDGVGTEDCLYLTLRSGDVTASKPVMVWIHGGGLFGGHCCQPGYSFDVEMTELLDVVTININYRLGFLGFHSIEELWNRETGVYANNGIRDMVAALQWIQDNVENFGGDPQRVTLVGHSGGGTAALALIASPLAVNLFHGAVVLAPAPEFRWDYKFGSFFQKKVTEVLEVTGCKTSEDKKKCLKEVNAKWLTSYVNGNVNPSGRLKDYVNYVGAGWLDFPLRYGKTADYVGLIMKDPVVIPQAPKDVASAKHLPQIDQKVKVIIGNTLHETVFYPYDMWNFNKFSNITTAVNLIKTLSKNLLNKTEREITEVLSTYRHLSPQSLWDTLTSDMRATCPLNNLAGRLADSPKHEVYRLFTMFGLTSQFRTYHGWETEALFGFKRRGHILSATSRGWEFRGKLVHMMKQFANSGAVDSRWGLYPFHSMTIDNSEDMNTFTSSSPNHENCEQLKAANLDIYGWQN